VKSPKIVEEMRGARHKREAPVQLVVASFQEEEAGHEVLVELEALQRERRLGIQAGALIAKDERGKIQIRETADAGGSRGAVLGGTAGAAIGLIAGSALEAPTAVCALIGGLAAKLRDSSLTSRRLTALGAELQPGTVAVVAAVEYMWLEVVRKRMAEAGAAVITVSLQADLVVQLEAGHDIAYAALTTRGCSPAARSAETESAEGRATALRDDLAYGARFVSTPLGFVVEPIATPGESADEAVDAARDAPALSAI